MSISVFNYRVSSCLAFVLLALHAGFASAQTTAFTFQGKLSDGASPANGTYDIQFKLFDTATVGTGIQQGPIITNPSVLVTAGIFTVQLDFGAGAFSGPPRFLEIGVRVAGSPDPYTLLSPRQAVTSTPYSVRSLNSSVADALSSACVGCVTSTQVGSVSGSSVTGTIPVASVPAGSGNYIQNTGVVQAADFAIDGDGRAYLFSASTEYQIGGQRVLGVTGSANTFAGIGAGSLTTGDSNSFFGRSAGASNTSGGSNSFFGELAGNQNSTGFGNSFFGGAAGTSNSTGGSNAFFGRSAGLLNTSGNDNSFFGSQAGSNNITGINNSFFGRRAGLVNTASNNSFFGYSSGDSNTTGTTNAFFGTEAGAANTTANGNAFFGYRAGFINTASFNSFFGSGAGDSTTSGTDNAFFGYNTGQANQTGASNSFFGSSAGGSNTTGTRNSFFGRLAGSANTDATDNTFVGYEAGFRNTANFNSFFGNYAGAANIGGTNNAFFGYSAGTSNITGHGNSFFGYLAGQQNTASDNTFLGERAGSFNTSGGFNTFVGLEAGNSNTTGSNNTIIGGGADISSNNLSFATAIGAFATVGVSNSIVLGRSNGSDAVSIPGTLHVAQPVDVFGLHVSTDASVDGFLQLGILGGGGSTNLCRNTSHNISTCSSSLRYKSNVQSFSGGLDIVRRLRPIAFTWKEGGMHDVGFGAEEVEKVEPLLTTRNDKGEIEGVKYGQVTTVLVNAVKEQQAQITAQQRTIEHQQHQNRVQQKQLRQQQQQLDALKKLVCLSHPRAGACK